MRKNLEGRYNKKDKNKDKDRDPSEPRKPSYIF